MKFLEVNDFLRNYLQYFANDVEQNFMKRVFLGTREKDSIKSLKQNLTQLTWIHYFTVFATTKPISEPAVVARLGLPDISEFGFVDFA